MAFDIKKEFIENLYVLSCSTPTIQAFLSNMENL